MSAAQPDPTRNETIKVDLVRDKLSQAQINYMKMAQQQNAERVSKLRRVRRINLVTGAALGLGVISIFGYSMWAVGSEKFLDEGFDVKNKN